MSCAAALALAVTSTGPTAAQPVRVKSGILDCDVSGGWGFIIGSQKTVQCLFTPDQPGPREPYVGVISKFGYWRHRPRPDGVGGLCGDHRGAARCLAVTPA